LITKSGKGRGKFLIIEDSNPRVYDLPFVFYPRAIRRYVSDYLPVCRGCFACPQFYTIDNIIRRNGSGRKGGMLQQGNGPLILRRNSNEYFSVRWFNVHVSPCSQSTSVCHITRRKNFNQRQISVSSLAAISSPLMTRFGILAGISPSLRKV
jgi:hypothetical protein